MADGDPWWWTIRTVRQELAAGRISHTEYLAALHARTSGHSWLNAFAHRVLDDTPQSAVAVGSYGVGELAGVPLAVKDNIDTCDAPTTAGTAALQGRVPGTDSTVVARLRAASGLLAGKTVMHELS